ncbi:hypothetical protein BX661DRAFT_56939 [Kickxella alabastrina]|uniref:uncharacterized protein n=1 Tax=Kickxella alabastrina TaxID=61397 RepID=UPI00222089D3|nr:uncharacterized protein BX661DRAFT_56939 [Kickxella alabastrina]KAI7823096.1 hypothetical protein BX661DRAFT_56939 [Kickxella alabastrina]
MHFSASSLSHCHRDSGTPGCLKSSIARASGTIATETTRPPERATLYAAESPIVSKTTSAYPPVPPCSRTQCTPPRQRLGEQFLCLARLVRGHRHGKSVTPKCSCASCTANKPTPPMPPLTTSRSPACNRARTNACFAASPATGTAAAATNRTVSGIRARFSSSVTANSATVPACSLRTRP